MHELRSGDWRDRPARFPRQAGAVDQEGIAEVTAAARRCIIGLRLILPTQTQRTFSIIGRYPRGSWVQDSSSGASLSSRALAPR